MRLPATDLPVLAPQASIWAAELLGTIGRPYNVCWSASFDRDGAGDAVLEAAVDGLIARHPALHARLPSARGVPVQRFDRPPSVASTRCPDDDPDGAVTRAAMMRRLVAKTHDLERDGLSEMHMVSARDTVAVVVLHHHVVGDGLTRHLLAQELSDMVEGREPPRPDDYEEAVRESLALEEAAVADVDEAVAALAAHSPGAAVLGGSSAAGFASKHERVHDLGRRLETAPPPRRPSPATAALVALRAAMTPCLPDAPFAAGLAVTTRPAPETRVAGCFVNTIPVVIEPAIPSDSEVAELASRIAAATSRRHLPLSALAARARALGVDLPPLDQMLASAGAVGGDARMDAVPAPGALVAVTLRLWRLGDDVLVSLAAPCAALDDDQVGAGLARASAALDRLATLADEAT